MRNKILWDIFKCPLRKMHSYCVSQCPNKTHVAHSKSDNLSRVYLWMHCLQIEVQGKHQTYHSSQSVLISASFPGIQEYSGTELVVKWRGAGNTDRGTQELKATRQGGEDPNLIWSLPSSISVQTPDISGTPCGGAQAVDLTVSLPGQRAGLEGGPGVPCQCCKSYSSQIKNTHVVSHQLKRLL